MVDSWIFQSNIKYFDIDNAVKSLPEITWPVRTFRKKIKKGDKVLIWRSGPDAGIIAIGTIITDIITLHFSEDERKFMIDNEFYLFRNPHIGVRVHVDKLLNRPILKKELKSDKKLSTLSVINNPQGTNFPITPKQVCALNEIISSL